MKRGEQDMVAHFCNPRYSGRSQVLHQNDKSQQDPILKKKKVWGHGLSGGALT
jgi:hypothetical protein